jgi:hypothetical protein
MKSLKIKNRPVHDARFFERGETEGKWENTEDKVPNILGVSLDVCYLQFLSILGVIVMIGFDVENDAVYPATSSIRNPNK